MNKWLALVLIFLPALATNISISCPGECVAYLPASGLVTLNYTVNGSRLPGLFRTGFEVNVSGTATGALLRFNLSRYGCEAPGAAFVGLDPLESAWLGELLLARADLSANTTVKLFCSGFNDLAQQAGWLGEGNLSLAVRENLTYNGSRTVLSGLDLLATVPISLNETHEIEMGRGNLTVVNLTGLLNASFYNLSLQPAGYVELGEGDSIYTEFGSLGRWFYIFSFGNATQGNITLINESLGVNATLAFNRTGGVAVADPDGDGSSELVACVNITDYNLTVISYAGSWTPSPTNFSCSGLGNLEAVSVPGANATLVSFNSTGLLAVVFNKTVYQKYLPLAGVRDISSYSGLLAVAFTSGDVHLYNLSGLSLEEVDYLGRWASPRIDAQDRLLVENASLSLYSMAVLPVTARLAYSFPVSIPVKLELNITSGGTGNLTVNVSVGSWYYNTSSPASIVLYPEGNGTLWVNLSFSAVNGTHEPWAELGRLRVWYANASAVNNSAYTEYLSARQPIQINTSLSADRNFTIIGAEFIDEFRVGSLALYLKSGSYNFLLDGAIRAIKLWKPAPSVSASSAWLNSTPVQGSQSEGNFSLVVGFRDYLYFPTLGSNRSTYGKMRDYCAKDNLLAYTWGNATLFRWSGSLEEVGNITGNFTECWLGSGRLYLVNSTGGLEIYNTSLSKVDSFVNSSFLLKDVLAEGRVLGWNGTHIANLSGSSFTLQGELSYEPFVRREAFYNMSAEYIEGSPAADVDSDSLWERLRAGLYSVFAGVTKLFAMLEGKYASYSGSVSSALTNGTVIIYTPQLSTPSSGNFTNFSANTTYTPRWVIANYTHPFRLNITVSGFIYNSTDTLVGFSLNCTNSTGGFEDALTRYANHSFTVVESRAEGRYDCTIYPTWSMELPKTLASKTFTLYVDGDTPAINNATGKKYVSSQKAFNLTVNLTETGLVKTFRIYPSTQITASSVSGAYLISEGDNFKIYNVSVNLRLDAGTPLTLKLNISAEDYLGRVSQNFTTGNITIYDASAPSISISEARGADGFQGYDSVPLNLSASVSSDANLSYVNITVWQSGSLVTYSESTGINSPSALVWLNTSSLSSANNYTVRVRAVDITGNAGSKEVFVLRYPSKPTITISGKWLGSTTGTVKAYWEHTLEYAQGSTDKDTGANSSTKNPFSVILTAPNIKVDKYSFNFSVSSNNFEYLYLEYDNAVPDSATVFLRATANEWGINSTDRPSYLYARGLRSVQSTEALCLNICDDYNVSAGSCKGSWSEFSCTSEGIGKGEFKISGTSSYLNRLTTGTGFRLIVKAVSSSSSDTTQQTTQTTQTTQQTATPTASISITGPASLSIGIGECERGKYTIKNSGDASASLSKLTVSGLDSDKATYELKSSISFPYSLGAGKELKAEYEFCPKVEGSWTASVCVNYGSSSKCKSTTIKGVNLSESKPELKLDVQVEKFGKEYVVTVNSTWGLLEEAEVVISYPDGTNETFKTNAFGKVSFKPRMEDFIVRVNYRGKVAEKGVESLKDTGGGLDIWRVLLSVLIVGLLLAVGIFLDERAV